MFYLATNNGASGPLEGENGSPDGNSRAPHRAERRDTLAARLRGIAKSAARIAELVGRSFSAKRAQSDLLGHRRRLLGYLAQPATDMDAAAERPSNMSLTFTPDDLEDGAGDPRIINFLCPDSAVDEPLLFAHVRTLVESVDRDEVAVAARWLDDRALAGIERDKRVRYLTVRPGHSGDRALEGWLDSMLTIWENDLGRRVATSVAGPGAKREGEATGPLIDFLMEAGEPLGIQMGTDAWRRHVRDALAIRESKNV